MAGCLSHSELQPKRSSTLIQRIMEFFVVHLSLPMFSSICFKLNLSLLIWIWVFSLWLRKCVFSLCFCLSLKHTVLVYVSKDKESISGSQVSEKLSSNSVQRLWLIPFLHLGAHCVIGFSCPEPCLHTVGKLIPWWMLHKEHVSLAISQLQPPAPLPKLYVQPGLSMWHFTTNNPLHHPIGHSQMRNHQHKQTLSSLWIKGLSF